jgi:hypothetical protein
MVAKRSANELSEARGVGGTIIYQGRGPYLTVKALTEQCIESDGRPEFFNKQLAMSKELVKTMSEFKEMKQKEFQSPIAIMMLPLIDSATTLKQSLKELKIEFGADASDSTVDMLLAYHKSKESFDNLVGTMNTFESKYKSDVVGNITKIVGESQEGIKLASEGALKLLKKQLSDKRASLQQVAGGKADGSSWKAALPGDMGLSAPEMGVALKTLSDAYIAAIEKRLPPAKKAFNKINES